MNQKEPVMTALEITGLLRRHRIPFGTEQDMQDAVQAILNRNHVQHAREVLLSAKDRIDFLSDGSHVGIECKVSGSRSAVLAQLVRYAEHAQVTALILVTSRHTHRFACDEINGKPLFVVWVGGSL